MAVTWRASEAGRSARHATALRLRGRDAELSALDRHLAALAGGRGGVLLLEGAPGAGKTSILDEAEARAVCAGLRAFRGTGDPAAVAMPLAPLLDALLDGDPPVLDAAALRTLAGLPDPRFWILQELQERLERAALDAPIVVAIDDLQWADDATQLALRTLPRRLSTHAILWVLARRPRGAAVTASRLEEAGAQALRLGPLPRAAVAQVAQDTLGAAPDAALVDLACDVEGRPLFLIELLRGLRDEGLVEIGGGVARLVGRRLPSRFRDTVATRVDRLSEPAREIVQTASVLGRRFTAEQLAMVLERSAPSLLRPLQEALESGLLVERADALAFHHDLVREAVDVGLPASIRAALRRRAVDLLLESDAPVAEVAALLADVARPGDRVAVGVLRRAAAELAETTPMTAARMSRRALELLNAEDPGRPEVLAETIPLLFRAGLVKEARGLADLALEGRLAPEVEAAIRLGLAQVSVQYSFSEVERQARLGLALPGLPAGLRLSLQVTLTLGHLMTGDFRDARASVDGDLEAARAAGDLAAEVAALYSCSAVAFHRHRYREALDHADAAHARALTGGPDAHRLWPDVWGAWLRGAIGDTDAALPRTQDGLRAAQREGRAPGVRLWLECRSAVLLAAGRLSDARAEAEAVLETVDELGPGGSAMNQCAFVLGCVALHTGDGRALGDAAAAARRMRLDDSVSIRRGGDWLAARIADGEGDPARAMELLADTFAGLGELAPTLHTPQDPFEIVALLRIALRAGAREHAGTVAREIERRAALNPGFRLHALLAAHARGLLERDPGAMRATVDGLAVVQNPVARAHLLEDAAGVLSAADREAAVGHLDTALALLEGAGAERDAARVRSALRGLGVRRRRYACTGPASGWAGLTEAELAVVQLVAAGATNRRAAERLYLSPHTVSSHLRHAFEKLGIRSRVELAMLYAERGA